MHLTLLVRALSRMVLVLSTIPTLVRWIHQPRWLPLSVQTVRLIPPSTMFCLAWISQTPFKLPTWVWWKLPHQLCQCRYRLSLLCLLCNTPFPLNSAPSVGLKRSPCRHPIRRLRCQGIRYLLLIPLLLCQSHLCQGSQSRRKIHCIANLCPLPLSLMKTTSWT